jgi:CheY-like chemotaxis protein
VRKMTDASSRLRGAWDNERMSKHLCTTGPDVPKLKPGLRLLLVDDDPLVLEALHLKLDADGFECVTATDGLGALAVLGQASIDIVILDLRMPNMSGYELIPKIRSDYPQVGLIVNSAEPEDEFRRLNLPIDAYLQKYAHSPEFLVTAIEQAMQRPRPLPDLPADGSSFILR